LPTKKSIDAYCFSVTVIALTLPLDGRLAFSRAKCF